MTFSRQDNNKHFKQLVAFNGAKFKESFGNFRESFGSTVKSVDWYLYK